MLSFIGWLSRIEAAHVVCLIAQLAIAFSLMNVQVVTRFVSSTPAVYMLYGYVVAAIGRNNNGVEQRSAAFADVALRVACVGFCVVWGLVGTAMFPNFMPWT